MQLTHSGAEKKLKDMNMDDMPVIEVQPAHVAIAPDWFAQYKKLCREFARSLSDSVDELAFMNLTQDEFINLLTGRQIPQNISIRFRVPLAWGGRLDTDNLFMCWTFPYSQNLDKFIIDQSGAKTIWLPNPAKKVYMPAHMVSGGDGGNATADRLSQMAAQIAASRGMEV